MLEYTRVPAEESDRAWLDALRRRVNQELFNLTFGGWDEERHLRHEAACWEAGGISIIRLPTGDRVGMIQVHEGERGLEIGEVEVDLDHQGRGLGAAMIAEVQALARTRARPLRLSVGLKNDAAARLYRRLGFRVTGRSESHQHMVWQPGDGGSSIG